MLEVPLDELKGGQGRRSGARSTTRSSPASPAACAGTTTTTGRRSTTCASPCRSACAPPATPRVATRSPGPLRGPVGVLDPLRADRRPATRWGGAHPSRRAHPAHRTIAGVLNLLPNSVDRRDAQARRLPRQQRPRPRHAGVARGPGLLAFYPFGPTSGSAANITLMSYRRHLLHRRQHGHRRVQDPDVFMRCLRDGFDEVLRQPSAELTRSRHERPLSGPRSGDGRSSRKATRPSSASALDHAASRAASPTSSFARGHPTFIQCPACGHGDGEGRQVGQLLGPLEGVVMKVADAMHEASYSRQVLGTPRTCGRRAACRGPRCCPPPG